MCMMAIAGLCSGLPRSVSLFWVVWPGAAMAEARGMDLKERVRAGDQVPKGEGLLTSGLSPRLEEHHQEPSHAGAMPAAGKAVRRDEDMLLPEWFLCMGCVVWCLKFMVCLCWK